MISLFRSLRGTWPDFASLRRPDNQGVLASLLLFAIVATVAVIIILSTMPSDHHYHELVSTTPK